MCLMCFDTFNFNTENPQLEKRIKKRIKTRLDSRIQLHRTAVY